MVSEQTYEIFLVSAESIKPSLNGFTSESIILNNSAISLKGSSSFFLRCILSILYLTVPRLSSKSESNYLAALGLSTYTEIIGRFRYGDLRTGIEAKVGAGTRHINFITNYFNNLEYSNVDQRLKNDGSKGLYAIARSGIIHD